MNIFIFYRSAHSACNSAAALRIGESLSLFSLTENFIKHREIRTIVAIYADELSCFIELGVNDNLNIKEPSSCDREKRYKYGPLNDLIIMWL